MTQILNATDAMIEAGASMLLTCDVGGQNLSRSEKVKRVYTAMEAARDPDELREALEGAENWVVGPCKDRLGHVTSYDICFPSKPEDRGVAVVASVYSGEVVANAILAAIKSVVR